MPISNLAIQRKRMNELKRLGFEDVVPHFPDSIDHFQIHKSLVSHADLEELKDNGFTVILVAADRLRNRVVLNVAKEPIEKRKTILLKENLR